MHFFDLEIFLRLVQRLRNSFSVRHNLGALTLEIMRKFIGNTKKVVRHWEMRDLKVTKN